MPRNFKRFTPPGPTRPGLMLYFRSTLILFVVALVLAVVAFLVTIRFQTVTAEQVGVKVNNLTGDIQVVMREGTNPYNGILSSFYVLDSRLQTLVMVADPKRGERQDRDDLRIKTTDGSNVYLDLTINYKLIPDPQAIVNLVRASGLGDAYRHKWVRDFSRSICRTVFGEMTTEEFYDAAIRGEKARKCRDRLNETLNPYGLNIETVIADKFRFHPEYEEKIRAKKLADQEVEEQKSQAKAAEERQKFRVVEATKKKEVEIVKYEGDMKQLLVDARARADQMVRNAEAYDYRTRLGADASYEKREKNAGAIEARRRAEAEGVDAMARALAGQGGMNVVKLEYTDRLTEMQLTGQPFTIEGRTERFSHIEENRAAENQGPASRPAATDTAGAAVAE